DRALAHCQSGLLDGFAHRRVGVNGAPQILGAAAVFEVRDDLADEFTGTMSENLRAKQPGGLRIRNHLHVAIRRSGGDRAAVGGEVELADLDLESLGLRLVLAETGA